MEYLFLHIENKDRYFNNLEIFIIWIHCIPFPPVGGTITKTNPSFGEKYLFALHRCIVKIYSTSDKRNISNCKKILNLQYGWYMFHPIYDQTFRQTLFTEHDLFNHFFVSLIYIVKTSEIILLK